MYVKSFQLALYVEIIFLFKISKASAQRRLSR